MFAVKQSSIFPISSASFCFYCLLSVMHIYYLWLRNSRQLCSPMTHGSNHACLLCSFLLFGKIYVPLVLGYTILAPNSHNPSTQKSVILVLGECFAVTICGNYHWHNILIKWMKNEMRFTPQVKARLVSPFCKPW